VRQERFGAYSPERRTALVLGGAGTDGAYHAGVLRALREAGVKIDLMAGHGVGAASAALAAIDGGARLWDANGFWGQSQAGRFYTWTTAVRVAAALALTVTVVAVAGMVTGSLNTLIPRRVAVAAVLVIGLLIAGAVWAVSRSAAPQRRSVGTRWWRLVATPVDAEPVRKHFTSVMWELIRGAAVGETPARTVVGRRYSEVMLENLGQPGFRELVLVATDLDARRDVVAALLREPFRAAFLAPRPGRDRRAEVLDLAGVERDYAVHVVAAGLTPPVLCEPEVLPFAPDGFWRGEAHRLCSRPGSIHRLLEEVAAAGATQVIIVSAAASVPGPHRLRMTRLDVRGRLGEFQCGAEAAALRDAVEMARLRFDGVYVIAPEHNPVGPFDLRGAYDEASHRRQDLQELMAHAYDDAYRQFIEPVVAASGEDLARAPAGAAEAASASPHADALLRDDDPARVRGLN
jgi:hypothetical protein